MSKSSNGFGKFLFTATAAVVAGTVGMFLSKKENREKVVKKAKTVEKMVEKDVKVAVKKAKVVQKKIKKVAKKRK